MSSRIDGMKPGPPSERLIRNVSITALLALMGFILADLTILSMRDKWLPSQPPPPKLSVPHAITMTDRSNYSIITSQNIFRPDQTDADPFGTKTGPTRKDAEPVLSGLPIQLVGTIVHVNPLRSIATVMLKSKNDQVPVRVDGEIPDGLAVVMKIERNKIIFRNNSSQQLEFIEMKDESKLQFNAGAKTGPKQNGEVLQKSETDFELKAADVNRLTSNLPELLQQARAVPVMGAGGQVEGFNLVEIMPGSIYEKLGLKKGDIIRSVNGERIDSPGKAMDMYNALRSGSSSIQIGIGRSGADQNLNFSITQ